MQNFDYQTPTRLIFGKGVISNLPEVMKPLGRKILMRRAPDGDFPRQPAGRQPDSGARGHP